MILISLSIVGLRAARAGGRETVVLANLHNLGLTLELFTQAKNGEYPFVAPGERIYWEPPGGPRSSWLTTTDPWAASYFWPVAMHDVAPWPQNYSSWLSPEDGPSDPPLWSGESGQNYSSYVYCNAFIASPTVWRQGSAPTLADIKPQRSATLASPSNKAIMFERDRRKPDEIKKTGGRRLVLAADGAAAPRWDKDAKAPFPNPLRGNAAILYHDTEGGLTGRDY